ncbi:DUF7147 family protein [Salirhabdus salicampi]|uniref:DUF7147 family protein n=1 Tax=Salirhabdus salicampi TaxID=476102 RepID=UPI0020C2D94B|nr:methylthioribose kinase [Salirhabdus salicampi]MCP8616628.1 methylthioribose kinase [Salirhabdus salicampi]
MIQRFIELGEGYSDIYELLTIGQKMSERVEHVIAFHSEDKFKRKASVALVMTQTDPGNFQPIYICTEGLPHPDEHNSQRYKLVESLANTLQKPFITLSVQPSNAFGEKELYFQHLISILRMNHIIKPLS